MLQIKWTDRITNGEVFRRAKEERLITHLLTYLHTYLHTYILTYIIT